MDGGEGLLPFHRFLTSPSHEPFSLAMSVVNDSDGDREKGRSA